MADRYLKEINKHIRDLKDIGLCHNAIYDFKNKGKALNDLIDEFMLELYSIFDYEGLPDNFDKRDIERYLLNYGFCAIIKENDQLWPVVGGLCGVEKSPVYQPTEITVANPALNISKKYTIGEDCALIRNDALMNGVLDILRRYCTLMVESNLSLDLWSKFGSRLTTAFSAADQKTRESAEAFIKAIIEGDVSVVSESPFYDGLKVNPIITAGQGGGILPLLELVQFIQAELQKKFGLSSNNNRKREALSSDETSTDDAVLLPLIDQFLYEREKGIEMVNKVFETNISVKKSSSWELIEEEMEAVSEKVEEETKETEEEIEEVEEEKEEVKDETDSE